MSINSEQHPYLQDKTVQFNSLHIDVIVTPFL